MSLRLPTRAFVPVVVLAVLGGIVATFIIARPPSSTSADTPRIIRPKLATPAAKAPAKKTPVRKAPVKAKAVAPKAVKKPVKKPVATPAKPAPLVPVARPATPGASTAANGLPKVLARALAANRVVVVGLYDPDAAIDQLALAEARAGARSAGAGFVALNVLADGQSRPLLELLGTLENPGVLVYRRPDTLFARIGGFADSETVAQAAANAAR